MTRMNGSKPARVLAFLLASTLIAQHAIHPALTDVHAVGRNASSTKPARFLVFLVKHKGAPKLIPVK